MPETTLLADMLFAVILKRKDGSQFLASGEYSAPALFRHWKDANAYRKRLREHGLHPGKIVRVTCIVADGATP